MGRSDHEELVANLVRNIEQLKRDLRKATHPRAIRTLQKSITDKGALLCQIMSEDVIKHGATGGKVLDKEAKRAVR